MADDSRRSIPWQLAGAVLRTGVSAPCCWTPPPDLYAAEQNVAAENDLVMVRLVVKATQKGDLLGVPASGTAIQWNAVDIYRIRDGRISEEWAADDIAAIMNQLGAFSPPWLG